MKHYLLAISLILFMCTSISAQESSSENNANYISKAKWMKKVPSLASKMADGTFIPAETVDNMKESKEVNPRRTGIPKNVPGKGLPIGADPLILKDGPGSGYTHPTKAALIAWEVMTSGSSTPSDPTAAVGPDHIVNAWNSSYRIWDKEGNSLTSAASLSNIWPGETDGDPIVMYDKYADRFIITQGIFSGSVGFLMAISDGPDPVNDGWITYEFSSGSGGFPDYPKYSIWSDGYYVTANKGSGNNVFVIERDAIIDGDADAQIVGFSIPDITTSGFYSTIGFNSIGEELPPAGDAPIVYLQDDEWVGVSQDHLKIWNIDVDWVTPANSTISDPVELETEVFTAVFDGGAWQNFEQPNGTSVDALQAAMMNVPNYRRFPSYNSVVLNFTVDINGGSGDHLGGIRWMELRQDADGDDWYIYQEGTYEQEDGHHAWCGSIATDTYGNIGMGFTIVSPTQAASIKYTGRYSSDPLGTMTIAEDTIGIGTGSSFSFRYGDYAHMTIDPVDDKTFWHVGEYFISNNRRNVIGAFKLASDLNTDVGVVAVEDPNDGTLTATQTVTVAIRNFGIDSVWNIPVSYSVDGGSVVTETYTDTIPPSTNVSHSFSTTADMSIVGTTYEILAYTALVGDEDLLNDTLMSSVTHLEPNDIGISSISDPNSASGLSDAETVKVMIENFGGASQSDFEVSYTIDGGTPVTEVIAGPLDGPGSMEYTFDTDADLSALGTYEIVAYTSLSGDSDHSNDTSMKEVENFMCLPTSNCSFGDGLQLFELSTIDNSSDCSPDGYGDFTDMVADLMIDMTYDLTLTTGYGNQFVKVWIDFNDNFVFESDELIIDDFVLGDGQGSGTFTETTDFVIPPDATIGEHLMRAKTNWNEGVPNDPCEGTNFGETEDYTANIMFFDDINEFANEPNELIISSLPNDIFEVRFEAVNTNETLYISVHNVMGQQLIFNRVQSDNGFYFYDFDMSYTAPGVYLVRLGNDKFGKVKKIVVE